MNKVTIHIEATEQDGKTHINNAINGSVPLALDALASILARLITYTVKPGCESKILADFVIRTMQKLDALHEEATDDGTE